MKTRVKTHAKTSRAELVAWDDAHVWHPFTPHSVYRDEAPLMIVAAEGHELIDADGRRYLDGVSSLWCNLLGHRRPEIDAALRAQLDRVAHATFLGNASAPAVCLARELAGRAPAPLTRVFYSDSGATAVEVALKMALQFWQQRADRGAARRTRFLTLALAYHGDTVGSTSLGGIDLFHARYEPLLFHTIQAPSPYCYRCPLGLQRESCQTACVEAMEGLIAEHGPELAAVFVEPGFQGAAGIITQPADLLPRLRAACDRAGTLLVIDEVAAGFGRSGQTLFACEQAGVSPDLLCLGKGLTGGYLPMAATLATERIFEAFLGPPEAGRTFFHGHTYTGNALAAAAALATLQVLDDERVLEGLPAKVEHLRAALAREIAPLQAVGEVRQWGLAVGIELVADRTTRAPFPPAERRGMRVCTAARALGVFLRPLGDVVVLMPPLTITTSELDRLVEAVAAGVQAELARA